MSSPVPLRPDFDATLVRRLACQSRDPDQTRRLLALAEIYAGGSRSDAARIGGVGLQIVRDWVLRFNAEGPDGLSILAPARYQSLVSEPACSTCSSPSTQCTVKKTFEAAAEAGGSGARSN